MERGGGGGGAMHKLNIVINEVSVVAAGDVTMLLSATTSSTIKPENTTIGKYKRGDTLVSEMFSDEFKPLRDKGFVFVFFFVCFVLLGSIASYAITMASYLRKEIRISLYAALKRTLQPTQ